MLKYYFSNNLAQTLLLQGGACWKDPPELVWVETTSNILITFAFYSIAALIIYFTYKRQDIHKNWITPILAICILFYATTNLIETWNLWYPNNLLLGWLEPISAIVSISIVGIMVSLIPTALTIPTPNELQLVNAELTSEIKRRQEAEKLAQSVNVLLAKQVKNRSTNFTWLSNKLSETLRKQPQVKEQLQLSHFAIERSADAVFWIAKDGKLIYVNDAACYSLGYSPAELLSMTIHDINSDFPKNSWSLHWNLLKKCGHLKIEAYHFHKNKYRFPVEITLNHLKFKGQEYQCLFARDISDRKKSEIALRNSEARERNKAEELEMTLKELRQTQTQLIQTEKMSSLGHLVAGIAHEINNPISFIYGNIKYSNQYIQDFLELINLYQKHYPHPHSEIQSYIEEIELDFLKQDVAKIMSSMQTGAERIGSIVSSLRNFARLDESAKKSVNIHDGINNTLLILKNRLNLVTQKKSEEIQIIKNYGDLPLIECYPGQLNQVFMNVLNNAIDALEVSILSNSWRTQNQQLNHTVLDMKKGINTYSQTTLNISSEISNKNLQSYLKKSDYYHKYLVYNSNKNSDKILDFAKKNNQEKLKKPTIYITTKMVDDNLICIRIADNGLGMNEQISKQIFDPFFTTKPVGKGKGLGLAISYKIIVEKHQGNIQCYPVSGEGCEFVIQIPVRLKKQGTVTSFNKAG
ncbi:ATP-binding protein [Okeania sp.]|uniref:sensor histidine kinase n=1 Tax=Okeania sp. TaxID=3100323 RepID=UPI002B4B7746|nr:ATP-binding protein [Okeania sp.]MEB3343802.1 ATP-binding protein [Okeania sp.]